MPDELQAFNQIKQMDQVIFKYKCGKQKHYVISSCKTSLNKILELARLQFSRKLLINESMCHLNFPVASKYCQLKRARKIPSTLL